MAIPSGYCEVLVSNSSSRYRKGVAAWTFGIASGLANPAFIADELAPVIGSIFGPLTMNSDLIESVVVSSLTLSAESGIGVTGSRTSDPEPPNVAALVKKNTGLRGRKNRGRFYLPGVLSETDVQGNGFIDPGSYATLDSGIQGLFTFLESKSIPMVVLHSGTGTPTPVSSLVLDPRVATQRKRLR